MKSLVLFLLLPIFPALAQVSSKSPEAVAREFIAAYNAQDYPRLFAIFPEPITQLNKQQKAGIEERLRKEYQSKFSDLGKMIIDTIFSARPNQITVKLHYQNDPMVPSGLVLSFDNTGIIQGMGDKEPDFVYPKVGTMAFPGLLLHRSQLIDSVVNNRFMKDKFNGSVSVIDEGKIIYHKGYGYSNFEKKTPLDDNTMFELASCTKQFTAMAIMMLAEAGKLNYSDSIQRFIPDLPYHNITIEQLLAHTSGLPDYMHEIHDHWDRRKIASNDDIIELLKTYKPAVNFKPNDRFQYSNTGYVLLSSIIAKASGMSYNEYLQKNIFEPLGMKRSRVYNTRRSGETIDNYAIGYYFSDSLDAYVVPDSSAEFNFVRFLDGATGDASVNSTILDLALWEKALRDNTLVKKETLERAYKKHILNNGEETRYGYGVFIQNAPGTEKVVYHSGAKSGYHTFILHFVDQNKSVIVLTNNQYDGGSKLAYRIGLILTSDK